MVGSQGSGQCATKEVGLHPAQQHFCSRHSRQLPAPTCDRAGKSFTTRCCHAPTRCAAPPRPPRCWSGARRAAGARWRRRWSACRHRWGCWERRRVAATLLTLPPLGSACPLRLLPHTASLACCLLCRRRTLCAFTSSSRRRQRQGAAKVGPGAATGAGGPRAGWQGSSPLTARCTHGLFGEHHGASHALLLCRLTCFPSVQANRMSRRRTSGSSRWPIGCWRWRKGRPRRQLRPPATRRRQPLPATQVRRCCCSEQETRDAAKLRACKPAALALSHAPSAALAPETVLQSSRRTKCTARPCRSTVCAWWRAWPPTTGGVLGAGCWPPNMRCRVRRRSHRGEAAGSWCGLAERRRLPPQRHRRRSALCLAVWRGLAQTCVLVSMLAGKRAVPRLLPLPRRCVLRSHAASARNEAVQPKLRARRVGRELASCESDLPIR
jgi:hypothetical protein